MWLKIYLEETNRKVMFEYALIKGVNDSKKDAEELAELVKGMLCVINLIPYNQTQKFKTAEKPAFEMFKKILGANKISVVQRYKHGEEIEAACGQLAVQS